MQKKKLSINFEYDYNFLLIGICSPLKDYTIGYQINKFTSINFKRSEKDITMNYAEGVEEANFAKFEYWDEQFQNQWYLLANKCKILCNDDYENRGTIFDGHSQNRKKTKYLIPENRNVDFYIQIHGFFYEGTKIDLIRNIKNIERIVSIHEINMDKLRSKENLIINE